MSGAMRRIGEYLGLLEDTGRYDDEYAERYDAAYDGPLLPTARPARERARRRRPAGRTLPAREARTATVADLGERRRPDRRAHMAELSRITTLHPRTYNEARTVGENFRDGTPVIMNLSEMDDTDAKRLVDFAAGLVFATRGTHRAGDQQGVPAVAAQRLGRRRGQGPDRETAASSTRADRACSLR